MIPIPKYGPDRAQHNPAYTDGHINIMPAADKWLPMPSLGAYSAALGGVCVGAFFATKGDSTFEGYAGTATDLFRLTGTTWTNISKSAAAYSVPDGEQWTFTQWRDKLVAHNVNDAVQVVTVNSGGNFADLAGSPSKARYSWVAGPHLVLGHLNGNDKGLHWSGVNNIEKWTARQNGSDLQTLADGGVIMGGVGYDTGGFIFQFNKIRVMEWEPGSGYQFRIKEFEEDRGVTSPRSIVQSGNSVYYLSKDGFYELSQPSIPIGAELVDRFFLNDVDGTYLFGVQGAVDPVNKIIYWRYKSVNGGGTTYTDKMLGYDWQLKQWFPIVVDLQCLVEAATVGVTLDNMNSFGNLDTLAFSLDSRVWKGGQPLLAGFNTSQQLGFFNGSNLEATIETNDVDAPDNGRITKIKGFRPIIDTPTVYGAIGTRQRHSDATTWSAEKLANSLGLIKIRRSARTIAMRARIPAATSWNEISGFQVRQREGGRR
jgi:hypothetical protein